MFILLFHVTPFSKLTTARQAPKHLQYTRAAFLAPLFSQCLDTVLSVGKIIARSLGQLTSQCRATDGLTDSICRLLELTLELLQQKEDLRVKDLLQMFALVLNPAVGLLGDDYIQIIRSLVSSARRSLKVQLDTSAEVREEAAN
jgi:hypothetical protein